MVIRPKCLLLFRPLDAATAFPALMLFNIINGPLILLPLVIAHGVVDIVAVNKRLSRC